MEAGDPYIVNAPMRFANADVMPRGPAPRIGQHTEGVLEDLGYSAGEIAAMANKGIIGTQQD